MDDNDILQAINSLVNEEHQLQRPHVGRTLEDARPHERDATLRCVNASRHLSSVLPFPLGRA